MPKRLRLRSVSDGEAQQVRRLAASRTQPARLVQRAKVIEVLLDHAELPAGKAGRFAGYRNEASGRKWVKQFNRQGLAGLDDAPRPGRPVTHDQRVHSALISLALQKPRSLGYPFELWTLERLQRAFKERHGVHLSDSTIWTWLDAEGLKWKRQQSWFHDAERHDPQFVEKRGLSSRPT